MSMLQKILNTIVKVLGNGVLMTLNRICGTLNNVFAYLKRRLDIQQAEKKEENIKDAEKDIDKACDKGNLSDLLDAAEKLKKAKTTVIIMITALMISGCTTVTVNTTESWEGHYYDVEQARKALDDAELRKKESIWIISNNTLKRLLKTKEN